MVCLIYFPVFKDKHIIRAKSRFSIEFKMENQNKICSKLAFNSLSIEWFTEIKKTCNVN